MELQRTESEPVYLSPPHRRGRGVTWGWPRPYTQAHRTSSRNHEAIPHKGAQDSSWLAQGVLFMSRVSGTGIDKGRLTCWRGSLWTESRR